MEVIGKVIIDKWPKGKLCLTEVMRHVAALTCFGAATNSIKSGFNRDYATRIIEECAGYKLAEGSPAIGAGKLITVEEILAKLPRILDTQRSVNMQNFNRNEQHARNLYVLNYNDSWRPF